MKPLRSRKFRPPFLIDDALAILSHSHVTGTVLVNRDLGKGHPSISLCGSFLRTEPVRFLDPSRGIAGNHLSNRGSHGLNPFLGNTVKVRTVRTNKDGLAGQLGNNVKVDSPSVFREGIERKAGTRLEVGTHPAKPEIFAGGLPGMAIRQSQIIGFYDIETVKIHG